MLSPCKKEVNPLLISLPSNSNLSLAIIDFTPKYMRKIIDKTIPWRGKG